MLRRSTRPRRLHRTRARSYSDAMPQPHELTMLEQAAAIRSGDLSPVELAEHYLRRIEAYDAQVGAYLTVTADRALDEARRA